MSNDKFRGSFVSLDFFASDDRKGEECTLGQCKRKEACVQVEIEFETEIEFEVEVEKDTSITRYDSMKVYCKMYTERC